MDKHLDHPDDLSVGDKYLLHFQVDPVSDGTGPNLFFQQRIRDDPESIPDGRKI